MKRERIIVSNLDVQYAEHGSGPVVLLLHGWGTSLRTFDSLIANCDSQVNRFVALDLPGFGYSEHPTDAWDVAAYASFVRSFLEKLDISQPQIIVGHSLGGRIAIKGIADGMLKPKKLILIASAGTAVSNSFRNKIFLVAAKIGKLVLSIPPLSLFKSVFREKLYAAAGSTDYLNAGTMKTTFLNVVRENLTAAAEKISIPTLLVWGKEDTVTPLIEARTLHDAIQGSELRVIPHAGHFVHEEKPQEVAHILATFIAL